MVDLAWSITAISCAITISNSAGNHRGSGRKAQSGHYHWRHGGIGRAAAELVRRGRKGCHRGTNGVGPRNVAGEISIETGHEVIGVAADMRDEQAVRDMVETVVAKFGSVDISSTTPVPPSPKSSRT